MKFVREGLPPLDRAHLVFDRAAWNHLKYQLDCSFHPKRLTHLIRGFKTSLGISPHRWVLNRRIALAQRLIYSCAAPLSEVAVSCGFADQSHLTRVFMRKVGSSPATWRRNVQR
jgi:methylphosphotriester-DNA--protein-cysteine methyltransferase